MIVGTRDYIESRAPSSAMADVLDSKQKMRRTHYVEMFLYMAIVDMRTKGVHLITNPIKFTGAQQICKEHKILSLFMPPSFFTRQTATKAPHRSGAFSTWHVRSVTFKNPVDLSIRAFLELFRPPSSCTNSTSHGSNRSSQVQ
jgi:hypothetical protein